MPVEPQSVSDQRRERWMEEIRRGKTRRQIAKENNISRQRVTQILGPIPNVGRRQEIHIYAVPELFEAAAGIAAELGLRHKAGVTAGEGSVGLLIEQIGVGELVVKRPDELSEAH